MKRILLYISIIFLISGCGEKSLANDNMVSQLTENIMLERSRIQESNVIEPVIDNDSEIIKEVKNEVPMVIPDNNFEITKQSDSHKDNIPKDDDIDTASFDYQIHRGRIDCLTPNECITLSLPIQFELKNNIDSVFYLEVKTNSNRSLGYFISYSFKDYRYDDYDTCLSKGNYLKEKLTDRITHYKCHDDGTLEVHTDYEVDME